MTSTLGLKIQEASKRPQEKLPQGGWHSLRGQGAMAWSRRPSLKFRLCPERLAIFLAKSQKIVEPRFLQVSSDLGGGRGGGGYGDTGCTDAEAPRKVLALLFTYFSLSCHSEL